MHQPAGHEEELDAVGSCSESGGSGREMAQSKVIRQKRIPPLQGVERVL